MVNVEQMRKEYSKGALDEESVAQNPVDQFKIWFEEAVRSKIPEPNAMQLSTVGSEGRPSARVVLLKSYDQKGFVFYTNYESRKGREIEANPLVHLLFFWPELERQVRIEGDAEKITTAESMKYFFSRPVNSQLGAWASAQSSIIEGRNILEKRMRELKTRFEGKELEFPSFWGGIRVVPQAIEFWQGRRSRLHDRIQYRKNEDGSWTRFRLSP